MVDPISICPRERGAPARAPPRAAPGAAPLPLKPLPGTLCLLEHPLGEGGFGTQSPVFSRNHKPEELCSLETESLIS